MIELNTMASYIDKVLIAGERVVYQARLSLWPFTGWILLGVVTLPIVIGLIILLWVWMRYASTELAITNKRIIVKFGFINRSTVELNLARVESLVEAQTASATEALSGEALARRLKEALATNTIAGVADTDARRRGEAEEVRAAQAAWKRLGPVPGSAGAELEERFRTACNRFFEQQPDQPASGPRRPRHPVATG